MAGADTIESLMNSNEINEMLKESDVNVDQIRHRLTENRDAFFGDSVKGKPIDYNKRGLLNEIFTNYKLDESANKNEYPYFDAAREQLLTIVKALGFTPETEAAANAPEPEPKPEEEEAGGFSLFD